MELCTENNVEHRELKQWRLVAADQNERLHGEQMKRSRHWKCWKKTIKPAFVFGGGVSEKLIDSKEKKIYEQTFA